MPLLLPLFMTSPLLDFKEKSKLDRDFLLLREYFETGVLHPVEKFLEDQNNEWQIYLDGLIQYRRGALFKTDKAVPNEEEKITEYARQGKVLAKELQEILAVQSIARRTWPLEVVERNKGEYVSAKAIPQQLGREGYQKWLVYESLAEIYFPQDFFNKRLFRYEPDYSTFPYDFLDGMLSPKQLYIWYKIHAKEGPDRFFDDLNALIMNRYAPKRIVSMDAFGLLRFFISSGNDQSGCNRFFTRRMKSNISAENDDLSFLSNMSGTESEERALSRLFLAEPSSRCNIRDPLEKPRDSDPMLVEQAVFNHLIGNYAAAVNLLFPIIEGICWDISVAEHLSHRGIYTDDSDLTTRDLGKRKLLDLKGSPIERQYGAPTLKDLLGRTKMKEVLHSQFLEKLCAELYPEERNPILHGVTIDYNDAWRSSRLLLVLEYLHHVIRKGGYKYPAQLDRPGYWTPLKSGEEVLPEVEEIRET